MIQITPAAIKQLKKLIQEHPEDPIVRLTLMDLDDQRLVISITLEEKTRDDDEVQESDGLTVAVAADSVPRMQGVTLDYVPPGKFEFLHPEPGSGEEPPLINLN